MIEMTEVEAIQRLELLTRADREAAHVEADNVLVLFLEQHGYNELSQAYVEARSRVGFWYA